MIEHNHPLTSLKMLEECMCTLNLNLIIHSCIGQIESNNLIDQLLLKANLFMVKLLRNIIHFIIIIWSIKMMFLGLRITKGIISMVHVHLMVIVIIVMHMGIKHTFVIWGKELTMHHHINKELICHTIDVVFIVVILIIFPTIVL